MYRDGRLLRAKEKRREDCCPHALLVFAVIHSLHHPLVEFVTRLPAAMKVGTGTPKELLVAALADLLPAEVVQQSKRGFTFPWAEWLRGPLRESVEAGLSSISPSLAEALNEAEAYSIWQSYLNGKTSWSRPWSLYVLNEWVKRYLD